MYYIFRVCSVLHTLCADCGRRNRTVDCEASVAV